ncbi:hypothetical protein NB311A_04963 [Nitrobacter sp. Nb-311A]|nr:hypothetical protein NB311A_04963 [Nitrobacter sp. Nb-311A]
MWSIAMAYRSPKDLADRTMKRLLSAD